VAHAFLPNGYFDDSGSATPFTLLIGLLFVVFPIAVLVLTVPAWEQGAVDAQDAARVAVRTMVSADDWTDGVAAAQEAVANLLQDEGLPSANVSVALSGSLAPGAEVMASVTVLMPATSVPLIGRVGAFHFTADAVERVDSYRDSLS
jgi:hypothetical protein